jgi:hypothetical protein
MDINDKAEILHCLGPKMSLTSCDTDAALHLNSLQVGLVATTRQQGLDAPG